MPSEETIKRSLVFAVTREREEEDGVVKWCGLERRFIDKFSKLQWAGLRRRHATARWTFLVE